MEINEITAREEPHAETLRHGEDMEIEEMTERKALICSSSANYAPLREKKREEPHAETRRHREDMEIKKIKEKQTLNCPPSAISAPLREKNSL